MGEFGVDLGNEARHHHRIHIGASDQETVDDVGRREAQRDLAPLWDRDATRNKHELRGDDPHGGPSVRTHRRSQIVFGELARQVQRLGVDPLDVARRIDIPGQSREHDHAERCGNEYADAKRPQQLGAENSLLVNFDRTELKGTYDYKLEYSGQLLAGPEAADSDSRTPSIATAVQQQLGLKLESTKAPIEILVIDRAEQPTAN